MPADLVPLHPFRAECIADAQQTLQAILDQAKDGEITSVVIAYVRPDGAINRSRSQTDDIGRLLGAVALAQARITREL